MNLWMTGSCFVPIRPLSCQKISLEWNGKLSFSNTSWPPYTTTVENAPPAFKILIFDAALCRSFPKLTVKHVKAFKLNKFLVLVFCQKYFHSLCFVQRLPLHYLGFDGVPEFSRVSFFYSFRYLIFIRQTFY